MKITAMSLCLLAGLALSLPVNKGWTHDDGSVDVDGDTVGTALTNARAIQVINPNDIVVYFSFAATDTATTWHYLGAYGTYSIFPPGWLNATAWDTLVVKSTGTGTVYFGYWR